MTKRTILVALALTALLGTAAPSGGDASGCSFYHGTPSFGGCGSGTGSCYYCEYNRGGAFSHCWENGDGSIAFCIDYRDN